MVCRNYPQEKKKVKRNLSRVDLEGGAISILSAQVLQWMPYQSYPEIVAEYLVPLSDSTSVVYAVCI